MQNELAHLKSSSNDILTKMHCSLQRIAQAPVFSMCVRRQNNNNAQQVEVTEEAEGENRSPRQLGGDPTVNERAVLSKCPRTLFVLWQEYEFGLSGNKAAKLFTPRERGRNKFSFCLRKPCWNLVIAMIQHGYNNNSDIDKVYSVYGYTLTVTKVLRLVRLDRRTGGHHQLRNFVTIASV